MKRLISITLIGCLCLFSYCSEPVKTCILKGEIVDHPCDSILHLRGPEMNLVELNGEHGVWYKYGVSNSGGGTFLVDREGKIIAKNPTADEVRKILKSLF